MAGLFNAHLLTPTCYILSRKYNMFNTICLYFNRSNEKHNRKHVVININEIRPP